MLGRDVVFGRQYLVLGIAKNAGFPEDWDLWTKTPETRTDYAGDPKKER